MVLPKIDGYDWRTMLLGAVRVTSASTRKFTVSDHTRTFPEIRRPPCEKSSVSMRVKGQGPAMQETLPFWNWFPCPASRLNEPRVAAHRPSGEQMRRMRQGTFAVFTTSKVSCLLPTSMVLVVSTE